MLTEPSISEEFVIKEYPNSTRWLEGQRIIGVGNLILTNERLVFLNQVNLNEEETKKFQELSKVTSTNKLIDIALSIHRMNFQVPLSSLIFVKMGLYSLLPFPRPCLRISYQSQKKKRQINIASFMFTISLLRGFFQLEVITVWIWVKLIRKAMRARKLTAGQ